jgi:outer membrane receptor protein involved in Fe transport
MAIRLKRWLLLLILLFSISSVFAGVIKGHVSDSRTGEPLAGATVHIQSGNLSMTEVVELDGSFNFKRLPKGVYEMDVRFVGYGVVESRKVTIANDEIVDVEDIHLQEQGKELQEVQVSAGGGGSDKGARRLEHKADIVQNILSARAIELSPDLTVGNAMARMSGVSVQRGSSGEGRYAIIRGMDQRYNNVLVNGIKIASPDDKYRFVPMDLFPSELLERLEVIKTLTPSMEGDAIGGTMNLVMKDAPKDFLLTANLSGGYSTLFSNRPFNAFYHSGINQQSPAEIHGNSYQATAADFPLSNLKYHDISSPINTSAGVTFGNRWLQKKLGFIISGAVQNFYRGSNSQYIVPDAIPNPRLPTDPNYATTPQQLSVSDKFERHYSTQTTRVGINNKIDYVFNSHNKISLYNFYVHQDEYQSRLTPDTTLGVNSGNGSYTMKYENRSTWTVQNIYNATLQGSHELSSKIRLDWTGSFSDAHKKLPDQASNSFDGSVVYDSTGKGVVRNDSTGGSMTRVWSHNSDKDWSGYANLFYTPTIGHRAVEFETGGMYRYKTRNAYYNEYNLQAKSTTQEVHSLDSVAFVFPQADKGAGNYSAVSGNNYVAHEKIASGFLQAKFMLTHALQVLGGVRVEDTHEDYTTNLPFNSDFGYGTIHYTDVLPSAHLKYMLNSQQNIRLSYYKSISRPSFAELAPYIYPGEFFTEIGNPNLKHTRADNFDLRYEWFPGLADQLLLGVFYKTLENPIEYFVVRNGPPSSNFIRPQNGSNATNYGFEAVFTKYFGMFGVSLNYTYTHSRVTTPKLFYHFVGSTIHTDTVNQTRPLQGQADHIGNLSLLFKNPKSGLDLQLALSYTGDRIDQVQQYVNEDLWDKAYVQLDFSGEKRLTRHFYFFAKINNLLNSPHQIYMKFPHAQVEEQPLSYQTKSNITIMERDYYNIGLLGGFRFKF